LALTQSQIRSLKRKAANNSLEVEYLLKVAAKGDASAALLLRQLKAEHGWSDTGRGRDGKVVPLGRWPDVVCCFLEHGYDGVVTLACKKRKTFAEFCISLLTELKAPSSVRALIRLGGGVLREPARDPRLALLLAGAFNLLLSFKGAPQVKETTTATIRKFLHGLLQLELSEPERATCVCALRGVGEETSIALIAGLLQFRGVWSGVKAHTVRQIRKRTRRCSKLPLGRGIPETGGIPPE
jgi:hypothetical protein